MASSDKLEAELKSLAMLSPVQLRQSWLDLSGFNLPHASPSLLRHLIAHQLQEKAVGKLPTYIDRELHGKTIAVQVTEKGFEWDGDTYRSLSEIARKVTGAHWSGPRFFGLTAKAA